MRRYLLVLAAAVVALAGCTTGHDAVTKTGSTDSRYVAADGKTVVYPPAQRKDAPAVTGSTVDGGSADLASLKGSVVVMNFWAAWCPPCHQIAPVLEQIAKERAGKLRIVKMDYDANPVTPSNYRVMGLPTLILFAGGRPVASMVGARPKSALLRDIDATLESIPAA